MNQKARLRLEPAGDARLSSDRQLGLRVWFGSTRGMAKAHSHQDLEFNCVHQGWLSYFIAGQVVTIHAGHLAAIWGAMPHQTIGFSDDLSMAWGTAPLGSTLISMLPARFVEKFLGSGVAMTPGPCATDWPLFERWERDLQQASASRRDLVQREMELRLLRLAMDVTDELPRMTKARKTDATSRMKRNRKPVSLKPSIETPASTEVVQTSTPRGFDFVQRMAAYMTAHYTQPLQLEDVTAQVPLHPNYAITLFRQHMHMTLNTYLTRQRVTHAQRLLATTDHTVLSIAMDSGFGSHSRFFEAFKQHAGCSPRAYRKQLAGR